MVKKFREEKTTYLMIKTQFNKSWISSKINEPIKAQTIVKTVWL